MLPELCGGDFGENGVDEDAGAHFEAGHFGQARDEGDVPVDGFSGGGAGCAADEEVVVGKGELGFERANGGRDGAGEFGECGVGEG